MRVADLNRIGRYYEYRESPAILTRHKVVVSEGLEPPTMHTSSAALSGAGYKPDALPLSYETKDGDSRGSRTHKD